MTPVLARVVQTCRSCPSQWDAWTTDGQYLYLRYRHGIGTVDAYDTPDPQTWTVAPDGHDGYFQTLQPDSFIELEDFCDKAGLTLAPDADVSYKQGPIYVITIGSDQEPQA